MILEGGGALFMRKIYTGIDIGSDTIKIVVAEVLNENFHVLASTSTSPQATVWVPRKS